MGRETCWNCHQGQKLSADLQRQTVKAIGTESLRTIGALFDRMREKLEALAETAAKPMDRLRDLGRSIFESTRTPLERYERDMDDLREAFRAGVIDLETFRRAAAALKDSISGPLIDPSSAEAPTALEVGSREAADFAARLEAQARAREQRDTQVIERQNQVGIEVLREISRKLNKANVLRIMPI